MSLSQIGNCDYVVLLCEDLAETRAFYKDVLGFMITLDSSSWISFRVGSTLLTLRPRGPWLSAWDDGPMLPGSAAVQLAFRVSPHAIECCRDELLAKGVNLVRDLTDIPAIRHRTLFFRDPEQNVIEIYAEY